MAAVISEPEQRRGVAKPGAEGCSARGDGILSTDDLARGGPEDSATAFAAICSRGGVGIAASNTACATITLPPDNRTGVRKTNGVGHSGRSSLISSSGSVDPSGRRALSSSALPPVLTSAFRPTRV